MNNQETNNQETSNWWDKLVSASKFSWQHLNIPFSALFHPKDTAYAIMVGNTKNQRTFGTGRSVDDIAQAIDNRDYLVKNRGNISRNLASLYIYGNDLGQFREAPELIPYGVNYDSYLRSIGRDPSEVVTYEGDFGNRPLILPEGTQNILRSYILSKSNHTYGDEQPWLMGTMDDVGGYLRRLNLNDKGEPIVVNSDLWDFEPNSYNAKRGHGTQAQLLDFIGTPFILKQIQPIEFVDPDYFYDRYENVLGGSTSIFPELYKDLGILPSLEIIKNTTDNSEISSMGQYWGGQWHGE